MSSTFLNKINQKYQVVADKVYTKALLAWEFDPDFFQNLLQTSLRLFKTANIPFDLLQGRHADSTYQMLEQGFNLNPNAKGNDWCHVSIGMFDKLKIEEFASVLSIAKSHIPTYKMLKISTLEAPSSGLNYLVLDLDSPQKEEEFKKYLKGRFKFTAPEDKGFAKRPHVSILGFKKEDLTKVQTIVIPALNKLIIGKTTKPNALQLWQNFQVEKHIILS